MPSGSSCTAVRSPTGGEALSTGRQTRATRCSLTAANGGVAPVDEHNANTYGNWGCRCPTCKASHSRKVSRQRVERYALTAENSGIAPTLTHNWSTYKNWGCRCETCKAASAASLKAVRAKAKLRKANR